MTRTRLNPVFLGDGRKLVTSLIVFLSQTMSKSSKKTKRSKADILFDVAGAVVPSCGPALRLAELGQERTLSVKEKFILLYNSPLCLHCNCNRVKFKEAKEKMRVARANRK